MEWDEFNTLQAGDRVRTTHWGDATIKRKNKGSVILYKFDDPKGARHCPAFYRTEIICKL